MRRYELMLVLRPDVPDDRTQATIDRITRSVGTAGGQIVKVSPWGRRRLAYPIKQYREGSYHLLVFDAEAVFVTELERSLGITEEVMRHLVTRIERPAGARRPALADRAEAEETAPPPEEEPEPETEVIDESETEAAPAAIE
ncbi:MAG TPA: 30S ribosomal protein S6 [Candidatus Limnocylindrales bacterium]|jgi:small subunit ribosomal protein S6|nr:30S ribosomal protein S6 [Candidatus Limnocylindrales bacterium]